MSGAGLAVASAVTALVPNVAEAQQGATVLVGSVTDAATGKPIVDAFVTVTSPNLQGEEYAVTDETGQYRIPGLPPGVYTLRVQMDKYKPYTREGLDLHADTTIRLNASMLPATLQAKEVVVKGRTPTVDVGSSTTGMNITSDFTSRIPLSAPGLKGGPSRSIESVIDVVPGAQPDSYGVSVFGATSLENRYLIDGLSVGNVSYGHLATPMNIEFVKEISVLSGGYMPEYGRATGGILNAITKSGTNEFHGSTWAYYAPGQLEGNRKTVSAASDSIITSPKLRYMGDIGGDVGGPIIKDKLWFYTGFDFARNEYNLKRYLRSRQLDSNGQPVDDNGDPIPAGGEEIWNKIPGTQKTYTARSDTYQFIGKLTWAVNKKNRVNMTVNGVYPQSGGDGRYGMASTPGLTVYGAPLNDQPQLGNDGRLNGAYDTIAHKYLGSSTNAQLKWSAELDGKKTMLDTWVGYHYETGGRMPADGSQLGASSGSAATPNMWWSTQTYDLSTFEKIPGGSSTCPSYPQADGSTSYACPVRNYHTGGPESISDERMHRAQARSIVTHLFQGLGHHVLKSGVDMEYQRLNNEKGYSGGLDYVDGPYYPYLWVWGTNFSYLQGPDDVVIQKKLTNNSQSVSLGAFVQDSWNVMDTVTLNLGLRYDAQMLYNTQNELAMTLPKQWSPRAGLIYDWTKEGKSKIYTSWARYYENVPLRALDRYLSGESRTQAAPLGPGFGGTCNPTGTDEQRAACLDPNNYYTDQSTWYPPNSRYAPYATGTAIIDPNIKAPSTDEFVLGTDYEIIRDGRLGVNYVNRRLNHTIEDMSPDGGNTYYFGNPGYGLGKEFPKATRKYDAVTLQFAKMYSAGWLAQTSYTASWLRGNYSGLYVPETGQSDPHMNSDFDLPTYVVNKNGYLPGDRRHQIKAFAAKSIDFGAPGSLTPGLAFRGQSGTPFYPMGRADDSHPYVVSVLPRDGNDDRLPWTFSIDLRAAYNYQFTKTAGIQFTFDIFNLFNFQQITRRESEYATNPVNPVTDGGGLDDVTTVDGSPVLKNPNYRHATAFQAPRMFRFGLKGTF